MKTTHRSLRPRLLATVARSRTTMLTAAVTALVFAGLAMHANAGTTQLSAVGMFNDACQAPVGGVPADTGNAYPPIDLSGDLDGCWYTYVSASRSTPSGAYLEQGTELFVGCLDGNACGSFTTTYTFTGKFEEDGTEIHGRCEHSIVDGTGDFAGAKGVINFKDDVVNLKFDLRGHISLATPTGQDAALLNAAKLGSAGTARVGGC